MKVVVFNLGCKVNQYDSDMLVRKLLDKGFDVSESLTFADYYIINTCAVTAESEKKSRQCIARVKKKNPNAKILVCGCASQKNSKQFIREGVTYISGTANKNVLAELDVKGINVADIPAVYEDCGQAHSLRTRSYIKIQDGCNNFCSYCIVPYLRGRSRSRQIDSILSEIENISKISKEIVLTGINLSAYGLDIGINLAGLIDKLCGFDIRIRLGSLEINAIDENLLNSLAKLKNFCPHFHLSLQSGDDSILKAMNRHYTTTEFLSKVQLIRKYFPESAITTDIISGFPTETEKEFNNTVDFIKTVEFSDMHIFPYSRREGTVAYKMKPIEPEINAERVNILNEIKQQLKTAYNSRFIGKPLEVLFEDSENGYVTGYSKNYIKIYSKTAEKNSLSKIIPTELFKNGLK